VALLTLFVFPRPRSTSWPGTAATILPALLIALAVVGRLYPDPAQARIGDLFSIFAMFLTAVAEIIAISAAASDHALTRGNRRRSECRDRLAHPGGCLHSASRP
jgi:hypothetical protein